MVSHSRTLQACFLIALVLTFPDPGHSAEEQQEITMGAYYWTAAGFRLPQWECGSHSHHQRKAGDEVGTDTV